jgi:hypothetical protein
MECGELLTALGFSDFGFSKAKNPKSAINLRTPNPETWPRRFVYNERG